MSVVNEFKFEGQLLGDPVKCTSKNGNMYYTLELQVGKDRHRITCFQDISKRVEGLKSGTLLQVTGSIGCRVNPGKDGREFFNPELRIKDVIPVSNTEYSMAKHVEPTHTPTHLDEIPF